MVNTRKSYFVDILTINIHHHINIRCWHIYIYISDIMGCISKFWYGVGVLSNDYTIQA